MILRYTPPSPLPSPFPPFLSPANPSPCLFLPPKPLPSLRPLRAAAGGPRRRESGDRGEDGNVSCEVDVVSWRERRIKAQVVVKAGVEAVWCVLTDYDRLADFIPNLVYSGTVPCPHPGRIWLEQRGLQRALYWHIEARVVLDLRELPNTANGHELHFSMVDGDFKKFEGKWCVQTIPRSSNTTLSYEVNVIPRFNFPAMFIERIISSDLPVNLRAFASRAETFSEGVPKLPIVKGNTARIIPFPLLPSVNMSSALFEADKNHVEESIASSGVGDVLSAPSPTEVNGNWGVFGKFCSLDKPCMVDEVHLRRYDGLLENGGVHRCVIASITVKAPLREVWNVLTAYEKLPEIVPNLIISRILFRENNKVRILQEGCKGLLYMVLHARVVLDLDEKLEQEISFQQVEGDFDSFHGKWLLEQFGNQHTMLKYFLETKVRKDILLSEAIVEEVVYEDLPSNLCSIRDFVEKGRTVESKFSASGQSLDNSVNHIENKMRDREGLPLPEKTAFTSESQSLPKQRTKVPGLQRDIEVLKSELLKFISDHGQEGFMPMRKQLRSHGRVDIEKAIARMGGFRKIASMMNLSLAYKDRKPKGYWDNLENLQEEISRFQRNWGMDPTYMPSRKSFERAGRYDIARALEKWGGLHEVSRLLSLELRHPLKEPNLDSDRSVDVRKSNSSSSEDKTHMSYVSQDTQKWLLKLQDLDINWFD